MDLAVFVSFAAMLGTCAACLLGLYSRFYQDNYAQAVGMLLVGAGAAGYAYNVVLTKQPPALALSIGLLAFAVGTALKVWQHNRKTED